MMREMTIVYLMRNSETQKPKIMNSKDSLQLQNEKWILTKNGEKVAEEKSKKEEFQSFDIVISSNYVRAISTAKYFTKDDVYIEESFGERKFGIKSWDELPLDFEKKQFEDFNYKVGDGESLKEVQEREIKAFDEIIKKYKGKKVLIVGHAIALSVLLSRWCTIDRTGPYLYNNKAFFDGHWNYCETFKLVFDDLDHLASIDCIK